MADLYPGEWINEDSNILIRVYLSNDGHRLLIYRSMRLVIQKYYPPDRRQEAVLDAWSMADLLGCETDDENLIAVREN